MADKLNIAVVGATGLVGETMLAILAEREFPADKVYAIGSKRSFGKTVEFGRRELPVEMLSDFDFSKTGLAFFPPAPKFLPNMPNGQPLAVAWSSTTPRVFVTTTMFP